MIATFWLVWILSSTMMREIECMYEMPLFVPSSLQQARYVSHNELAKDQSPISRFVGTQQDKRNLPSLSISNSLDVLRQRLMLEIARRQMRERTNQIDKNRELLDNVGKRTGINLNNGIQRANDLMAYGPQMQHHSQIDQLAALSDGRLKQLDIEDNEKASVENMDDNVYHMKIPIDLQNYRV